MKTACTHDSRQAQGDRPMTITTPEQSRELTEGGNQVRAVYLTRAVSARREDFDNFLWSAFNREVTGHAGGDRATRGTRVLNQLQDWGCYQNDWQWERVADAVRDLIRRGGSA